jgi:outer membrane murein-binding lipoprotein Lpp
MLSNEEVAALAFGLETEREQWRKDHDAATIDFAEALKRLDEEADAEYKRRGLTYEQFAVEDEEEA